MQPRKNRLQIIRYLLLFSGCIFFSRATSQVMESVNHQAYEYLYRMAQKGIVSIDDYILPLDRSTIRELLDSVKAKSQLLSTVEKQELEFYANDFLLDVSNEQSTKLFSTSKTRPRLLYSLANGNSLMLDPIIGFSTASYLHKSNVTYFGGVHLYGKIGKHIGFNFLLKDITENGDTINLAQALSPYKGRAGGVSTGIFIGNNVNYSDMSFNIGYKWNNGLLSIGKDNQTWGYAQSGNLVLSQKAPSYPYIRLDYYPFKWLHFNYMHGWLASNIIDSNRIYGIGLNSNRITYVQKFIAHHSITIAPTKGLKVSIGESIVYSDRFDAGYLIPINFFKAYDHYASNSDIRAGGNGQVFLQVSSRNHIKNTHLYGSLFIDEIRMSKIFSANNRNQLGYNIGANITDAGLRYLTLGAEYVHVNPFVYSNLIPAQSYANHSYSLGDWMGNNADRLYLFFKYTPVAKLKVKGWYQYLRKGGAGTIEQQYDETKPQPAFLFDKQFNQAEAGLDLRYEWYQTLKFNVTLSHTRTDFANGSMAKGLNILAGFSYGL